MGQEMGGGELGFSLEANAPYAVVAAPRSLCDPYEESRLLHTSLRSTNKRNVSK
jgi:hypothetical protein